jgi:hypothetical protein
LESDSVPDSSLLVLPVSWWQDLEAARLALLGEGFPAARHITTLQQSDLQDDAYGNENDDTPKHENRED